MRSIFILIIFSLSFLFSVAYAQEKKVSIAIGNFHPFFPKETDTKYDGIFYEIIEKIFESMGKQDGIVYKLNYHIMPNARITRSFKNKTVDAAANIFEPPHKDSCFSENAFRYRDTAMTLKSNEKFKNKDLKSIQDLANPNYNIVSYQDSTVLLGNEYEQAVKKAQSYQEYANQETTGALLAKGRTDIRIGDINIFLDSIKNLQNVKANDFQAHWIFKDIYAGMAFWDKKICLSFKSELEKFKKEGEYEKIYNTYLIKNEFSR